MNINEIAKIAGVSPATISRFLNNGYVSNEKKEIIKKVIEETGYTPLSYAQTLRTKKNNLIGVIVPKISSEALSRMVSGISLSLENTSYNMILGNTDLNIKKEFDYLDIFRNDKVDGIIFIATILSKKHFDVLSKVKVPVVILSQKTDGYSCVYNDDYNASLSLTNLLIEKGCNTIAYIGVTQQDEAAGKSRKKGFIDALKQNNLSIYDSIMYEGEFSIESGFVNMKNILSICDKVDGVFCATDNIAVGAMQYLRENNIKVPQNIKIVSIGDSKISRVVYPELTTAHYYYKTGGIEAGKLLLDILCKNNTVLNKQIKLGFDICERETTK